MTYPALTEFINRVQRMRGTKSKEMRISSEDATRVSMELTKLLLDKVIEIKEPEKSSGQIDGGRF